MTSRTWRSESAYPDSIKGSMVDEAYRRLGQKGSVIAACLNLDKSQLNRFLFHEGQSTYGLRPIDDEWYPPTATANASIVTAIVIASSQDPDIANAPADVALQCLVGHVDQPGRQRNTSVLPASSWSRRLQPSPLPLVLLWPTTSKVQASCCRSRPSITRPPMGWIPRPSETKANANPDGEPGIRGHSRRPDAPGAAL